MYQLALRGNYDIPTIWLTTNRSASELPKHWTGDEIKPPTSRILLSRLSSVLWVRIELTFISVKGWCLPYIGGAGMKTNAFPIYSTSQLIVPPEGFEPSLAG